MGWCLIHWTTPARATCSNSWWLMADSSRASFLLLPLVPPICTGDEKASVCPPCGSKWLNPCKLLPLCVNPHPSSPRNLGKERVPALLSQAIQCPLERPALLTLSSHLTWDSSKPFIPYRLGVLSSAEGSHAQGLSYAVPCLLRELGNDRREGSPQSGWSGNTSSWLENGCYMLFWRKPLLQPLHIL